jgi:hypothetical protein
MKIRLAVEADLPRLVEMGQRFREDTRYHRYLTWNSERVLSLLKQCLSREELLVGEEGEVVGFLAFIIHDHFLSGDRMVSEILWWVEPEHRGEGLKLLEGMKRRGKAKGATHYQAGDPGPLGVLYRRLKMERVESTWQGTL